MKAEYNVCLFWLTVYISTNVELTQHMLYIYTNIYGTYHRLLEIISGCHGTTSFIKSHKPIMYLETEDALAILCTKS